jgi:hypothetical protein
MESRDEHDAEQPPPRWPRIGLLISVIVIVTVVSVGIGMTVAGAWPGMAQWMH